MWMELERKLSMQYSVILMGSHEIQAFTQMEQGLDGLLDTYLNCTSELLSKIYHTSDISRISVEDFNHYAVVYGLYCRKLKDSVMQQHSVQWKVMEDGLKDICNIGAGYKRVKAIAEPNSIPQTHHVSLESKP